MAERLTRNTDGREGLRHYYWCEGCDSLHGIAIRPHTGDNGAGWEFTGTLDCPTYAPSQLSTHSRWTSSATPPEAFVCHTFIRQGLVEFLRDSTHALAGQTRPMAALPDWVFNEDHTAGEDNG